MELNQTYNGDCLELMKNIPDCSVDMILCDLPYGTTACKWDVIIPFDLLWEQYKRIIKPNGAIVLTAVQPFTSALVMSNPKMFRHSWVWEKEKGTNFATAKYSPLRLTEDVLVFSKKKPNYMPIMTPLDKPYSHVLRKKSSNDASHMSSSGLNELGEREVKEYTHSYPKNILRFNRPNIIAGAKGHPTQKPVPLFEYLIKTYTNEGETVLDNCAGSGTTAIACINTNRNYICMEKDTPYYNGILKRVEEHNNKQDLFTLKTA